MTAMRRSLHAPGPFEWARYLLFEYIPFWAWMILGAAWAVIIVVAILELLSK